MISILIGFGQFSIAQNDTTAYTKSDSVPVIKKITPLKKYTYRKSTGINAVYSLPLGHFGSTDLSTGGFASPGWGIGFDNRSFVAKGFYFVSKSTYSWLDLDNEALMRALDKRLAADGFIGTTTSVTGGQYRPFFTTIGLGKDFYINQRIQVGITAQLGVLYTSFKSFEIDAYDAGGNLFYSDVLKFDPDFAFAYNFGATFNFFLIPEVLAFHLEGNYTAANTDSYLRSGLLKPIKANENLQLFNINFGFIFCR